ncbi:patatin-like phospholipase [Metarhizium robertsii]|uniref:Patatin-like phospholipase n=1 Tax=Metarhizium robertsii TaxID=568076 RepID=A0A0A1UMX8_9HYPO|nr:patatin-like phospholipase [Metarhizium robertsii]
MCMNQSDMRVIEAQITQWMLAWREAGTGTPLPGIVVLLSEFYPLQPVTVQRQLAKRLPTGKICVVRIEQSTWSTDGFGPIRERLGQTAVRTRRWKINHNMLFSGRHMMGLFEESFRTASAKRPFRYVEASRALHPVAPDLIKHLNNYVETLSESYDQSFAAESIAASFLLDHLTPGMHEFNIHDVFTVLYQGACRQLSENIKFPSPDLILHHMNLLHTKFRRAGGEITDILQDSMKRHRKNWSRVEGSTDTCFVCLRRRPEYQLPCSHTLCVSCVKDFGNQCRQNPDRFIVRSCFLCDNACNLVVLDRPPTTGVGLLCLDGGGVRGIVQTEILRLLEERIGLPIRIQEHFQLAAGVSAVLALWNRSLYSAQSLEAAIEQTYGDRRRMLDPSYASSIGARILLPVARSPEPSIFVFTNYNGVGDDVKERGPCTNMPGGQLTASGHRAVQGSGYELYGNGNHIAVSDVFFPPKFILGIGWLQDAGMIENNPITLLLSQYYRLYSKNGTYQFLLNIGSGSKSNDVRPRHGSSGGVIAAVVEAYKTSALNRVMSAYEWLLSGLSYWGRYTTSIDNTSELRDRCIRLDTSLEGMEARLDDVKAIPKLKQRVHNDASLSTDIESMADRIIASMFYFELEDVPVQDGATFKGPSRILCLRKSGDPTLSLLIEKLMAWNARFVVNDKVMAGNFLSPAFWDETGNFFMPVEFQTEGQKLSASLRWPDGRNYPLSGSPYRLCTLVEKQGLDAPFGLPDHRRWHRKPRHIGNAPLSVECEDRKPGLKRKSTTKAAREDGCKRRRLWWSASQYYPPK